MLNHPFLKKLESYKDLPCLVYKDKSYTYLELLSEVKNALTKLDGIGGVVGI